MGTAALELSIPIAYPSQATIVIPTIAVLGDALVVEAAETPVVQVLLESGCDVLALDLCLLLVELRHPELLPLSRRSELVVRVNPSKLRGLQKANGLPVTGTVLDLNACHRVVC
jgi:hypothetical protein